MIQLYIYMYICFQILFHYRLLQDIECSSLCYTQDLVVYLFFFNLIYLFLAALGLRCCVWAFSTCGKQRLLFAVVCGLLIAVASLVVEHGLQARGLQQLWHAGSVVVAHRLQSTGSVVVVHRLSCSAACGIFPEQGLNPCPLHWQVDSQPLHHQGSPYLFYIYYCVSVNPKLLIYPLPPHLSLLVDRKSTRLNSSHT